MISLLSRRGRGIESSAIDNTTSLLLHQPREVVSLAVGAPAADAIPVDALTELATGVLGNPNAAAFAYAPTEGDPGLRSRLLELYEDKPEPVEPHSLLITSGGMQGLDLVCKLFIDPGDVVVTESPTYTNGIGTIRSYEGKVLEVPVDGEGIQIDLVPDLVAQLDRPPKLFYIIPNFQNPTGCTLSEPRRRRLLELARSYDALVLEDDPYGWLNFGPPAPPSLRQLDAGGERVIQVNTFSKIIAPGLRLGWILAPPEVISRMIAAKQAMDTCTNLPAQQLIEAFIGGGHLEAHLEGLRMIYRLRHQTMQEALARELGDWPGVSWSVPRGGFFIWLRIPGVDALKALEMALEEGVAFVPGPAFSSQNGFADGLRLSFSGAPADVLSEAVRRLAIGLRRSLRA